MRRALAILVLAIAGCGGTFHITAARVERPVSASSSVLDAQGRVRTFPDDLELAGSFEHRVRHWTLLWGLIGLGSDHHDLSDLLDDDLRRYRGDAIVDLEVAVPRDDLLFNLIGFVPLLPTRVTALVTGDVVRLPREAP